MFKIILHFNGYTQEAKPLDLPKAKIKAERQKEHIFFRRKFTGSLQFIKEDFAFLKAAELSEDRCLEFKVEIQKKCNGVFIPNWWKGMFSLNDVRWNLSKCTATVQPKPDDPYRYILDYYGKDYNVLEVASSHTVSAALDLVGSFEFVHTARDQKPDENEDTYSLFLRINYWVDGDAFTKGFRIQEDIHFRLVRTEPFLNGLPQDMTSSGWNVIGEDQAAQTAKYAKRPDLYDFKPYEWNSKGSFTQFANLVQVDCNAAFDASKYIDVTKTIDLSGRTGCSAGCLDLPKKTSEVRCKKILWEFGAFTFDRNRRLLDVLDFLVTTTAKMPELLPIKSDFFTSEINYVTNQPNELIDLLIAQKSDIIGYNTSEAARIGNLSLKTLLDALRQMFDVYWFINDEGKFQIEHIAYFEAPEEAELTEAKYPDFMKDTNAYEYDTAEMPRFQRLKFAEASNPDFVEGSIEYSGACVTYQEGADTEEAVVNKISTDIENIIVSANSLSKEGFVLIAHENGSIRKDLGAVSNTLYVNACLSAANLVKNYHTYNRILPTGLVNNQEIATFKSVRKTKKQISLRLNICCNEPNPYSRFITDVSANGELKEMETALIDGMAVFTIVHETGGSGSFAFERQFDESFDFSFR